MTTIFQCSWNKQQPQQRCGASKDFWWLQNWQVIHVGGHGDVYTTSRWTFHPCIHVTCFFFNTSPYIYIYNYIYIIIILYNIYIHVHVYMYMYICTYAYVYIYSANLPAKITGFQRLRFWNAAGEGDCGPDASKQHAHHAAATTSGGLSGACNEFFCCKTTSRMDIQMIDGG